MVSRAGKELLKNTIRLVGHHNKVLEEQEMWKQWELARGLTMMVTDQEIANTSQQKKHSKREKHVRQRRRKELSTVKATDNLNKKLERWDHNGYLELYPEEEKVKKRKMWHHSSYLQIHSEEAKIKRRRSKKRQLAHKESHRPSLKDVPHPGKNIKPCGQSHVFHKISPEDRSKKKGLCFSSVGSHSSRTNPNMLPTVKELQLLRETMQKPETYDLEERIANLDPRF